MKELDFDTEEGRKEAQEYFMEVVKKDDKEELGKLLFSMMEFIVQHEVNFVNIKNIL